MRIKNVKIIKRKNRRNLLEIENITTRKQKLEYQLVYTEPIK